MLRLLEGLPANVVGIEAVGKVEADNYRTVLDPAVAKAAEGGSKVRLLYLLGAAFEGYSAGAAWQDTKLGAAHWSSWERVAVVTDHDAVAHAVKAFAWMIPGEVRVYGTGERSAAESWVGG